MKCTPSDSPMTNFWEGMTRRKIRKGSPQRNVPNEGGLVSAACIQGQLLAVTTVACTPLWVRSTFRTCFHKSGLCSGPIWGSDWLLKVEFPNYFPHLNISWCGMPRLFMHWAQIEASALVCLGTRPEGKVRMPRLFFHVFLFLFSALIYM